MKRDMIKIDEDLCDGCGLCVDSCAEGALQVIDGKAKLVNEIYCDGLGACLGDCPTGALTIEKVEAEAFDEEAAMAHVARMKEQQGKGQADLECGCPGTSVQAFDSKPVNGGMHAGGCPGSAMRDLGDKKKSAPSPDAGASLQSQLGHWPIQLKLVPPHAPFLKNADILICADCVPFVIPDFHSRFLAGHAVLVGCPKLDDLQYYKEKLTELFKVAVPASIKVLKMEVPCCNGIAQAAIDAHKECGSESPIDVVTISIRGQVLDNEKERYNPFVRPFAGGR